MVVDSMASAISWEPFRVTIAALGMAYFFQTELVQKHKHLLDLITWNPPPKPDVTSVQAVPCSKMRAYLTKWQCQAHSTFYLCG